MQSDPGNTNSLNGNLPRLLSAWLGAVLAIAGSGGWFAAPVAAQSTNEATYDVTFQGNWTTSSTPGGVVGGAHFTTLIGAVHSPEVTFWSSGSKATRGVESVAELGSIGTFRSEVRASRHTDSVIQQNVSGGGTGSARFTITVKRSHPLVTLLSMIGPSPDWFVGVSGESLLDGSNQWRQRNVVSLFPYDAGTEDGTEFSLSNPSTSPQGVITSIRGKEKFSNVRMARLTFVRQPPPPPPPPQPVVRISGGTSVTEGGNARFTVTANPVPTSNLAVNLSVGQSGDFAAAGATGRKQVTVPPGGTDTYTVATVNDGTDEPDGAVTVRVNAGTDYTVGSPDSASVTVTDNDDPPPPDPVASFASASQSAGEGSGTRNVMVNLSPAPPSDITLRYTVRGTATEGSDYTILSGTLPVSSGTTTASIPVSITDDSAQENSETVILTLIGGTGYTVGSRNRHTLTITDNDDTTPPSDPETSFASVSQSAGEGSGTRNVTVNLSRAAVSNFTLSYRVGGTATEGSDYTTLSRTLPVSSGTTTASIPVSITDDSAQENSETVILTLTAGDGYTVGSRNRHTLTITDNDAPPPPPSVRLSAFPNPVREGGTVTITARLSEVLGSSVTIPLRLTAGTAETGDYGTLGSITIAGGRTSGTGAVTTAQDDDENDETFTVRLGALPPEVIPGSPQSVTVRIDDDDGGSPTTSAPGPPRNLMAVGGDGEVVLRWQTPASDGGAAITDYEYRIDRMNPWISTGSTDTAHTVSGLVNGTAYSFEVRAVTSSGAGSTSSQAGATPEVWSLDFAHFANGGGFTSDLVFVNPGSAPVRPVIYFHDSGGDPIAAASLLDVSGDLEVTEDGGLTVLTPMEPLQVLTIPTHGRGDLLTGSVQVISDSPLGGSLYFAHPGVGLAVVAAGQPTSGTVFPARRTEGGLTTGVAIHNLEEEPLEVQCNLLREGLLLEEIEIALAANGQTSWLIEAAFPMTDTSDFAGSVRCDAAGERQFNALALEIDPGAHIFTALPLFPVNRRAGGPEAALGFAHFANGDGAASELVFVNPSTQRSSPPLTPFHTAIPPIRPAIYFYDTGGALLAPESVVDITGDLEVAADGSLKVRTEMEPLGVLRIATHGRGALVTGSLRVAADGPLGGMLRYDLPHVGQAVVGAGAPLGDAVFPARRTEGGLTTGVAIHNLETTPELVRCDLLREGLLLDSAMIALAANGQTSWLLDQAFPAADTSDFAGLVRCAATAGGSFSAVALEIDPGARVFTALPLAPIPERMDQK